VVGGRGEKQQGKGAKRRKGRKVKEKEVRPLRIQLGLVGLLRNGCLQQFSIGMICSFV